MKIKVLGTSSPYAHENSACPSYHIYDDKLNILLDCGSGSHRFFDMQKNLNGLNIFVSHLHHDHYNDLFNYLYSAYALHNLGLINEKIQVFLPNFPNNEAPLLAEPTLRAGVASIAPRVKFGMALE